MTCGKGKGNGGREGETLGESAGEAEGVWREVRPESRAWEPVSLATMPVGDNEQNTRTRRGERRWHNRGGQAEATETWLAGRGAECC